MDAQGKDIPCCTWAAASWTAPFQAFNALALLWTLCLAGQVQLFVTSGTIAQWYFAPQVTPAPGSWLRIELGCESGCCSWIAGLALCLARFSSSSPAAPSPSGVIAPEVRPDPKRDGMWVFRDQNLEGNGPHLSSGCTSLNTSAGLQNLCLAGQIQLFITSGTIAQWYFAPS